MSSSKPSSPPKDYTVHDMAQEVARWREFAKDLHEDFVSFGGDRTFSGYQASGVLKEKLVKHQLVSGPCIPEGSVSISGKLVNFEDLLGDSDE